MPSLFLSRREFEESLASRLGQHAIACVSRVSAPSPQTLNVCRRKTASAIAVVVQTHLSCEAPVPAKAVVEQKINVQRKVTLTAPHMIKVLQHCPCTGTPNASGIV